MKKKLIVLIICVLLSFLSGCSNTDLVNDPQSGEIINTRPSALQDGNYSAVSCFYNNDGYRSALNIEVHQGIISKATFRETDPSGNIPSAVAKESDLSPEEAYHQLITQLIKKQTAQIEIPNEVQTIGERFQLLAAAAISMSEEGKPKSKEIYIPETYTMEQQWEDDSISVLTVHFDEKNAITEIKYDETLNGESVDTRSFYSSLTEETAHNNSLSPLPDDPAHLIAVQHYNTMLKKLDELRKNGFIH